MNGATKHQGIESVLMQRNGANGPKNVGQSFPFFNVKNVCQGTIVHDWNSCTMQIYSTSSNANFLYITALHLGPIQTCRSLKSAILACLPVSGVCWWLCLELLQHKAPF